MQHPRLDLKRWSKLNLMEQMANIGSEVERALKWREKNNKQYAELANVRALELFDLTLDVNKDIVGLKEITRARELWADFFVGTNQYLQTEEQWRKYFRAFNWAARNNLWRALIVSL